MEIDQIETFLAVATYGGFHRAAQALRVSQPAVSARIRMLEESLNATLFIRTRSGISMSSSGKALRPHAEQLLRDLALARQVVHELKPSAVGVLSISAGLSISTYLLPEILKKSQSNDERAVRQFQSGIENGAGRRGGSGAGAFAEPS